MARILITGASGFTGRHLVDRLSHDGHVLHGLERSNDPSARHDGLTIHQADLLDKDAVARVIEAVQPERVVHLAAVAFVAHGDVSAMYSTNVVGTRNLLEALAAAQAQPESVVLASSANVYGNRREGELVETMPPLPANDYGVSKLAGEHLARIHADRLPIIITRPFNYTGVGQSEQFLIPKIVGHARRGERTLELGNLDVARDFSDVRSIVDAYARLLFAPAAIGQTFNLCSGVARSLREVLETIERVSGTRFDVKVNPAFVRSDEVRSLCGSRARLERAIGPVAMPEFEDTIRWMLEDPARCG